MDILDEFFNSEENQKKYGFEYYTDGSGSGSIIYKGDIEELMNIAYEALGFIEAKDENKTGDSRPELSIQCDQDGRLLIKDTETLIEADVDGVGSEPNFYIRFADENETVTIRFKMLQPELYPDNHSSSYRLPNSSLSAINSFFRDNYQRLINKWNEIRNDANIEIERIPNYRAINRIM